MWKPHLVSLQAATIVQCSLLAVPQHQLATIERRPEGGSGSACDSKHVGARVHAEVRDPRAAGASAGPAARSGQTAMTRQ